MVRCSIYQQCGGCDIQHLSYEDQLVKKASFLSTIFSRDVTVTANPKPWNYRNRMDFHVNNGLLCLKAKGRYDRFVSCPRCEIADERINELLSRINKLKLDFNMIAIRVGKNPVLLVSGGSRACAEKLFNELGVSVVWLDGSTKSSLVKAVWGSEVIEFLVNKRTFYCSATSFFQASIPAFELAINRMSEFVSSSDVIFDMYCGCGVIGLSLPHKKLFGVELDPVAIKFAKKNACGSGEFFVGDADKFINKVNADVIVVDPPRTGLGVLAPKLISAGAHTIIYLSCNPLTLKRDSLVLSSKYDLVCLEGFDFFSQTNHVEVLAVFKLKN